MNIVTKIFPVWGITPPLKKSTKALLSNYALGNLGFASGGCHGIDYPNPIAFGELFFIVFLYANLLSYSVVETL